MRDLNQSRPEAVQRPQRKREIPRPPVVRVAPPPPLKKQPPKEVKKPQEPAAQKPIARLPEGHKGGPINVQDIINKANGGAENVGFTEIEDEEDTSKEGKGRPAGVAGRDKRHQQRNLRAKARKELELERSSTRMLLTVDDDRPQRIKQRLKDSQKRKAGPTQPRKGKVPVAFPITVRSLSEAIGMRSNDVLAKLLQHGVANTNINSTLDAVVAETIALEFGCELEVKKQADAEVALLASLERQENPEDLVPRAPIVTVMGHVDHGKTSLLDKIRRSNVVATEAGGITQVIRAWRVDHGGHPVTFLDTPGHEAFTKMRARGAKVTDIAVIVVAADDGVMPQTEEAINHARAAGVPVVIDINKVDLPSANITKTRQQLYSLQVLPDNMGGDVPFVETSAATGKGVEELLDTLSLVAETLLELKANPKKPGSGTCLEAMLSEGEGVRATLVVQDGTLRKGDIILCGASYGRVRAMYDDLGRPINEAGPSVPVRITGLDEVPNADDPFQVVPDLAVAREIADKRKSKYLESTLFKREPARLESLTEQKISELKVILKADFRGSIEAIRKEMEKLQH
ncbi:MAG TPA: translation initiation factor IF-2, partial [Gemmataceae bacterium]|nr:translation initiation factor IF-2 [Gemmataceae bacterium]